MKRFLKVIAVAFLTASGFGTAASAASIGALEVVPGGNSIAVDVSISGTTTNFTIFGSLGSDLVTGSVTTAPPSFVSIIGAGLLLEFTILDQMLTTSEWVAGAEVTDGTNAASFGDFALITIALDTAIPDTNLGAVSGRLSIVEAQMNVIPLPAGAALMLAWIGLLGGMRYRARV